MNSNRLPTRAVLSAILLGLALLFSSCAKKQRVASSPPPPPPPPPPKLAAPPPPSSFEIGQNYFAKGDYARAAEAYETYLRQDAPPGNQDQALYRLALTYALVESPIRDMPKALNLLQSLVNQFPSSSFKPQAEFILSLEGELEKLRSDVTNRDERIRELSQEASLVLDLEGELERLRADVNKRDERIRELSQELESLKRIDMQRRPSPPPR